MLGNFRSQQPHNNFLLFVYALLLKWPLLLHPVMPIIHPGDSFLYVWLLKSLTGLFVKTPILPGVVSIVLLYLQALSLNETVNEQKLFQKPHHLVAMAYLLLTSIVPQWMIFSPVLLSCSLLIPVISRICRLQGNHSANKAVFNIGLLFGLSILIYFPSLIFILIVFLGLLITKAFRLNEWVVAFFGTFTPVYLLWSLLFLSGGKSGQMMPVLSIGLPYGRLSVYEWTAVSITALAALIGFFLIQGNMLKLLVQSRKSWLLFFLFLLLSAACPFLDQKNVLITYLPCLIPVSLSVAATFFYPSRRWFPFLAHWSLFILAQISAYLFIH